MLNEMADNWRENGNLAVRRRLWLTEMHEATHNRQSVRQVGIKTGRPPKHVVIYAYRRMPPDKDTHTDAHAHQHSHTRHTHKRALTVHKSTGVHGRTYKRTMIYWQTEVNNELTTGQLFIYKC